MVKVAKNTSPKYEFLKIGQNRSRLLVSLLFIVIFSLVGAGLYMFSRAAGNATFTLVPANSSTSLGTQLTVTIQMNSSSEMINAIQADLTYDQTKLQFVSINTAVGPFNNIVAQKSGGNGVVNLSAATSPAVSGTQTIATVTFNTIGVGTTAVNFAGTSAIVRSTDTVNILGTSTGGSYTVSDTTVPTIPTGLTMSNRTFTSINLSWTASTDNVGVTGYKIYRNGTYVASSVTNSYSNTGLSAGTSYNYTVSAYDAAGNNSAQSTAGSFSTASQPGDVNGDGHVNIIDLSILATNFGKSSLTLAQGDLNNDGVVNIYDLSILGINWGV